MTDFDPIFGKPIETNNSSNELSQASDEIFNQWTKGIRGSYASVFALQEQMSDHSAAIMSMVLGKDAALHHIKEIERSART